jgi:hypothetical protein
MQAVKNQISEAQKVVSGGGSEIDRAEAQIELEVCYDGIVYRQRIRRH